MKRRLAATLLIVTLPLGMTACHGMKSRKATPSTPAPTATANANPTQTPGQTPVPTQALSQTPSQVPGASGRSAEQACGLVDSQLGSFADNYGDPNDFVQALTTAEATINTLDSPQITNPDVKQAPSKVASALSDMVNFDEKYRSNPNTTDPNEIQRLAENLTTSLYTPGNLCPAMLK